MKKIEPTVHSTNFFVFPQDTNYHPPMIFGGKMLSEMDICAAGTVRRTLYHSPNTQDALTVGVDKVTFYKGAKIKDFIILTGTVVKLGIKSITVHVVATKEVPTFPNGIIEEPPTIIHERMAEGYYSFVAYDIKGECAVPHELSL